MEQLHKLTHEELVELLSNVTAKYTELLADRKTGSEEFIEFKKKLKALQQEYEARKNPTSDNITIFSE